MGHASGRWYLEVGVANRQGSTPQAPLGAETRKEEEGCHIFVAFFFFFFSNTGYLGAGVAAGSTPSLLMLGAPVLKPPSPGFLGVALAGKPVSSFSV